MRAVAKILIVKIGEKEVLKMKFRVGDRIYLKDLFGFLKLFCENTLNSLPRFDMESIKSLTVVIEDLP